MGLQKVLEISKAPGWNTNYWQFIPVRPKKKKRKPTCKSLNSAQQCPHHTDSTNTLCNLVIGVSTFIKHWGVFYVILEQTLLQNAHPIPKLPLQIPVQLLLLPWNIYCFQIYTDNYIVSQGERAYLNKFNHQLKTYMTHWNSIPNTRKTSNVYILHFLAWSFVLQKTYRLNTKHTISFRHKKDQFCMPCPK